LYLRVEAPLLQVSGSALRVSLRVSGEGLRAKGPGFATESKCANRNVHISIRLCARGACTAREAHLRLQVPRQGFPKVCVCVGGGGSDGGDGGAGGVHAAVPRPRLVSAVPYKAARTWQRSFSSRCSRLVQALYCDSPLACTLLDAHYCVCMACTAYVCVYGIHAMRVHGPQRVCMGYTPCAYTIPSVCVWDTRHARTRSTACVYGIHRVHARGMRAARASAKR
jgi:hypothetical protein